MSRTDKAQVTFLPSGKSIQVNIGTTVLTAARKAGVHIAVRCDGKAACLMCKVNTPHPYDDEGHLCISAAEPPESRKLGSSIGQGVRLSCQARVLGDLTVEVPEDRLKAAIRKQMEQQNEDLSDW
ncbi:2Fe-2S iron-sulfur cluster-binding protein [Paenibacillus sp. PsM32]|uniref:2Fe-2S iron-sulfur cluster-binding protein n=1 Tax=Paenibacillus sp. PsM32 TaxID=3030536 RepID=UPI00263A757C|nr:2Fe-2S iron-sulfur cluster-binding protein [Paenibacillus sp. PsM32]MDN4618025.1 2Fe-2S iron-sulfur cluster-binding protein [Paenibacillus sp. PsM32]